MTETITLIRDILAILALLIGALAGLFIFFQLAPVAQLRILPRWGDEAQQFLIIRLEIENRSRVRILRPAGRFQILEYALKPDRALSHFVPFTEDRSKEEPPLEWREPRPLFKTTRQIYPGETIAVEFLQPCSRAEVVLKLGLQINIGLNFLGRLVTRKREPWQQTTTCIVVKRLPQPITERNQV
jgi:hypothetical protein